MTLTPDDIEAVLQGWETKHPGIGRILPALYGADEGNRATDPHRVAQLTPTYAEHH